MIKLSDSQLVVLSAACQRADRNVLPLPANLKGRAQQKVVGSLLAKGLVEERAAGPEDAVWRTDEDGHRLALLATDAAFQALGIEVQPGDADQPELKAAAPKPRRGRTAKRAAVQPVATLTRQPRTDTKQAQLIAMLREPAGASLDEIVAATGWQAHTVRGAIAGALKKKLGLTVTSEKVEARGRVYRIIREPI